MKRLRPAVEAPYGTPLKLLTPFAATPRTLPHAVSTTGYADDSLGIDAAVMIRSSSDAIIDLPRPRPPGQQEAQTSVVNVARTASSSRRVNSVRSALRILSVGIGFPIVMRIVRPGVTNIAPRG